MSHTTLQRARPTTSSRSSILLRTSFAQIRRILPSNTFAVLAVRYARHRIDQKDSDTLRHNSVQTTEQARGLFYPLALYGLFTCCTSYRTGQTDFHPLALLRLAARATEQARRVSSGTFTAWRVSSGTFTACSIAKHQIGQTDFHPLTLDGSTIRNQLGLGGDQGFRRRLIYTPCWFDLQASYQLLFQGEWRRGPVDMMIRL